MPDDFHLLKTVSVSGGEVTLRIPQRWDVWPLEHDEGRWGCYEEERGSETDTGTLWIQVDHFRAKDAVDDTGVPDEFEDIVKCMAADRAESDEPLIENQLQRIDRGFLWTYVFDTEEDGEALRFYFFHYFLARGPNVAIIPFNLVLTHAQMDEPDYVELRDILVRELYAARLEPFRDLEEAAAERKWGELSRVNFADQIKIVVPDILMLDAAEAAALPAPPERPGGIDVEAEEIVLCDGDDDNPVSVSEAFFVDLLRRHLGEQSEAARFQRLPDGAMAYIEHAPSDGGDPESYSWWNVCFAHGKARIAQVTLRPSASGDGSPPDPAFARYLDGAVRRAEFPDFA